MEKKIKEQKLNKNKNENKNEPKKMDEDDNKMEGKKEKKEEDEKEKKKGYGSYRTTFDQKNVCWEFNTFVGCRKGSDCKWSHQYLMKESTHPFTGEKLNGMA